MNRKIYIVLTVCYMGLIFYLSSLPDNTLHIGGSKAERIFWNLAHIPYYGILTILFNSAFGNKKKGNPCSLKSNWKILIIALCIAILDELNQSMVPTRSVSVMDFLLDSIGIITALWIIRVYIYSKGKKKIAINPPSPL